MLSNCPHCKKEIEHEDYQFEIECSCGTHFNPFYDLAQSETGSEDPGTGGDSDKTHEPSPNVGDDYSESRAAFKDIVKFGEQGASNDEEHVSVAAPTTPSKKAVKTSPKPIASNQNVKIDSEDNHLGAFHTNKIFTPSDSLPFPIENYISPISAWAAMDTEAINPLESGFDSLWNQATTKGANAILSVKWAISPDGTRCLITGIAVRVTLV